MTLTITDVRAKFPDYDDLSDEQLAEALHKKFYADMPQADFYSAIGLEHMDIKESPRPKPRPTGPGPEVSTVAPTFGAQPEDPAVSALAGAMGADTPPAIGAAPRLPEQPQIMPVLPALGGPAGSPMRPNAAVPTVQTALGPQPDRSAADGTPDWIKAATAAKASTPAAPVDTKQYDPLLTALMTEVGNTPERVMRGFEGNNLASAESRLVDAATAIGVAKKPADKLAEVTVKRQALEAQIATAAPGERVQLEREFLGMRAMEKRLQDCAGEEGLATTPADSGP